MRFHNYLLGVVGFLILGAMSLFAVSPIAQEFAERDAWVNAKFKGIAESIDPSKSILYVLDFHPPQPVQRNECNGKPLTIADTQYAHGLFCHATNHIVVDLPAPGKTFSAMVGIDTNLPISGGSAVFVVKAKGKEVYRSEVLHRGQPGVPINVDLNGAKKFEIIVEDAGDTTNSDTGCWADAKVALANNKNIWLDELDIISQVDKKPYHVEPFISFVYDGQSSSEFLADWKLERNIRNLDAFRTEHALTYTDPKTNLVVRCAGIVWKDYPTVEWTVYFKNEGNSDTPILESIQAIDTTFERGLKEEFLLHHHIGDKCSIDSFEPLQTNLSPNISKKFVPAGGRPTNFEWPYYNLEFPPQNEGVIFVIGWPGQWASQFIRNAGSNLRVVAGQELTYFTLRPGEEIRTPLILLQFYKGDWFRAQNLWRRFMFDHNFPKDHGKPLSPKLGAASVWYSNFQCTQEVDIKFINRFFEVGMPLDYWWMDAGWYPGGSWPVTGTWEVDKKRFPGGIKAISDLCHSKGAELIVWFEMERVHPGTWLTENHPDWIFGGAGGGLIKLNEPDVAKWVLERVDKIITEEGIDLYRIDFNIDPLNYWRGNDAPNRQGITEIQYITNFLWYLDDLKKRHPGILIDSCASGGRRDDLETMRRAVPLLRTDLERSSEGQQCSTYGFGLWLPYFDGINTDNFTPTYPITKREDIPYALRSGIAPFYQRNWNVLHKDFDVELYRNFLDQWRAVVDYYFGDFYPLTKYSTSNDHWMAWQFDRPDLQAGLIQAFRRPDCPFVTAQHELRALEPEARYAVTDLDSEQPVEMTGRELMERGFAITISEQPGAALIVYKKVD